MSLSTSKFVTFDELFHEYNKNSKLETRLVLCSFCAVADVSLSFRVSKEVSPLMQKGAFTAKILCHTARSLVVKNKRRKLYIYIYVKNPP